MDYPRASVSPTQYRGIAGSGDEIGKQPLTYIEQWKQHTNLGSSLHADLYKRAVNSILLKAMFICTR